MPCRPDNDLEPMGLRFGLEDLHPKTKFRWLFYLPKISADEEAGTAYSLPPRRSARPSISWKEQEVQHITETIYYPFKPDWKPIPLHLYESRCGPNPVFEWIRQNEVRSGESSGIYSPQMGTWNPIVDSQFKREGQLMMLGGCGEILEHWIFENCYPQNIEWGELDMDDSGIVTVDITLRYDRAWLVETVV